MNIKQINQIKQIIHLWLLNEGHWKFKFRTFVCRNNYSLILNFHNKIVEIDPKLKFTQIRQKQNSTINDFQIISEYIS
jgi:hypothetical protein